MDKVVVVGYDWSSLEECSIKVSTDDIGDLMLIAKTVTIVEIKEKNHGRQTPVPQFFESVPPYIHASYARASDRKDIRLHIRAPWCWCWKRWTHPCTFTCRGPDPRACPRLRLVRQGQARASGPTSPGVFTSWGENPHKNSHLVMIPIRCSPTHLTMNG